MLLEGVSSGRLSSCWHLLSGLSLLCLIHMLSGKLRLTLIEIGINRKHGHLKGWFFFLTRELRRHHVRTSWGNLDFIFVTVNGFEYSLPQPANTFFLAPVRALLQINPPPRNVNYQTVADQGCQEVLKTMLLLLAGGLFLLWPHHHC